MQTEMFFAGDAEDSALEGMPPGIQVAAADANAVPAPSLQMPLETAVIQLPEGADTVRVAVAPGEIVTLPFGADASFLARLGDGNLAIRVGEITVILEGYAAAISDPQAPAQIVAADGTPLDIAALLAATDPNIEIETAAGPGGQGGQGADNSGAIFQQIGGGTGLDGFEGVGGQGVRAVRTASAMRAAAASISCSSSTRRRQ